MTKKETSGPAYPAVITDSEGQVVNSTSGMTLRDYFAGQVIPHVTQDFESGEEFAKHVYMLANAMLKERTK